MQKLKLLSRIWPFRKVLHLAGRLPPDLPPETGRDLLYVPRPRLEKALTNLVARGGNLVVYGPPNQGKTMLLTRQLANTNTIYIECRPGFKRTQIYRVVLSGLGYAVLVEKTRRGKATATVKLGIGSAGAEASAEGELVHVMQTVTVDLKNPSEVAHLISRITNLPVIVLNNFHLLDRTTKRNLLFDVNFFAERPNVRIIIVGSWSNDDYLEELEPAVAGRFRYLFVPNWSDGELREAATQWAVQTETSDSAASLVDGFLALAGGDISLFRSLFYASVEGSMDGRGTCPGEDAAENAALAIQRLVLGRFRRGLRTKLRSILSQPEAYLSYLSLDATLGLVENPKFDPDSTGEEPTYTTYRRTGNEVQVDTNGNPEYFEETVRSLKPTTTDIVRFLFREFHAAAREGASKIELSTLVRRFQEQQLPTVIALDEPKLKEVFKRLGDLQRSALIVPPMLSVDPAGDAMAIVDRRLTLFLQTIDLDDLEDLIDEARPRSTPKLRRRNNVFRKLSEEEKQTHIAQAVASLEPASQRDAFTNALRDDGINGESKNDLREEEV